LATSNDYNKLKKAWLAWRDAAGKPIRNMYIQYYELGNKAATLNKIPGHGGMRKVIKSDFTVKIL
jgi:hypothetical protein